ncbi:hypothetical protein ERJ75_001629700 [Trypanosoma vivax]|nr:hypothetical protein ERJ75_001629700 [Trypanosoma vivax]
MCPATWCQAPRARAAAEQARKRRRRFSAVRRPATCTHQLPAAVRRGSDWQGGVVTRRWSGGLIGGGAWPGVGRSSAKSRRKRRGRRKGARAAIASALGTKATLWAHGAAGPREGARAGGASGGRGNALQGGRSLGCFSWRCACCTGHLRAARAWMGQLQQRTERGGRQGPVQQRGGRTRFGGSNGRGERGSAATRIRSRSVGELAGTRSCGTQGGQRNTGEKGGRGGHEAFGRGRPAGTRGCARRTSTRARSGNRRRRDNVSLVFWLGHKRHERRLCVEKSSNAAQITQEVRRTQRRGSRSSGALPQKEKSTH